MPIQLEPVRVFISYAHEDAKYFERLQKSLNRVQRECPTEIWHDRRMEPGDDPHRDIREALDRTDLFLLLVTGNFLASDYASRIEVRAALEAREAGRAVVVPILVTDVLKSLPAELAQIEYLPRKGKTISAYRTQDEGWAEVAQRILELIKSRMDPQKWPRPVTDSLCGFSRMVDSGQRPVAPRPTAAPIPVLRGVGDFWQQRSTNLPYADLVKVSGTLCQYAPIIVGPPSAKRDLHRAFRRAIEGHPQFGAAKRTAINACLSISAGQMVYRATTAWSAILPLRESSGRNSPEPDPIGGKRLLGLYNSIVRNSIAVFVTPEFFRNDLAPQFATQRRPAIDVDITGRVFEIDNSYIRRFVERYQLANYLDDCDSIVDDLCRHVFALELGGPGTKVENFRPPSYVDGDVWLAIKERSRERFLTTFVDVTDPREHEQGLNLLREEVKSRTGAKLIARYDDTPEDAQLFISFDDSANAFGRSLASELASSPASD
jgi:hypothetical protein